MERKYKVLICLKQGFIFMYTLKKTNTDFGIQSRLSKKEFELIKINFIQ